jgi:uncharacterized membrane protein
MDLYGHWRDFTHMPEIMPHLERVEIIDETRSRWLAKSHSGKQVEWTARLTEDEPGRAIAWESDPGAEFATSGSVRFSPAPADKGTEVTVEMAYDPPAGALGDVISALMGENPGQVVTEGLRNFKRLMETGEIPTVEGQPRGTCGKERAS